MKTLSGIAPWLSAALLFALILMAADSFTVAEGAAFELPPVRLRDTADIAATAIAMPSQRGTVVFFDDIRYRLDDDAQTEKFVVHMRERLSSSTVKSLLVLADKRTPAGDLMKFAKAAGDAGAGKVLFAGRDPEEAAR